MWELHSFDRNYIMNHASGKNDGKNVILGNRTSNKKQYKVNSLFSFQWLLILSFVSIDHKLCHLQKSFHINPEEQITHSQRFVLLHCESS